jgi:drug/metabolite transporter (DMT)-like permease
MESGLAAVALGLGAAATWGAGDFSGGMAARRTSAFGVVLVAHGASLIVLVAVALLAGEAVPPARAWLWAGGGGLAGAVGLVLLYRALAAGRMGVVAPVSALIAAALPVAVAAVTQGLPGRWTSLGFALALVAGWLIAYDGRGLAGLVDLRLAALAGLGLGAFFVGLHQASAQVFWWPLVAVRVASTAGLIAFALAARQPIRPAAGSVPLILLTALLDTAGNGAYALAARLTRVDVAAVLGSLYPGATVLLAWLVLREPIGRTQRLGIAAALGAIVLIGG